MDPNDPKALADLLIKLSAQRGEVGQMGVRAMNLARTYFDKDVLSQKMLNVLEDANRN